MDRSGTQTDRQTNQNTYTCRYTEIQPMETHIPIYTVTCQHTHTHTHTHSHSLTETHRYTETETERHVIRCRKIYRITADRETRDTEKSQKCTDRQTHKDRRIYTHIW